MKNEVVPTSAPHKMAGNYFSAKKNFLHTSYACFFYQKNFQTSMTSGSAGLRKNMRDPPPPPTALFWNFGSLIHKVMKNIIFVFIILFAKTIVIIKMRK